MDIFLGHNENNFLKFLTQNKKLSSLCPKKISIMNSPRRPLFSEINVSIDTIYLCTYIDIYTLVPFFRLQVYLSLPFLPCLGRALYPYSKWHKKKLKKKKNGTPYRPPYTQRRAVIWRSVGAIYLGAIYTPRGVCV